MDYLVSCVHEDRSDWFHALSGGIKAATITNVVNVCEGFQKYDGPQVVLYLGSERGAMSPSCIGDITAALNAGVFVLPIVSDFSLFHAHTPEGAWPLNAQPWPASNDPASLVHIVLEQLGLEESQRRIFISHRRSDSLMMAEKIHDYLVQRRFQPFIDRFAIAPGARVQERIEEALSDAAFVLFIESPQAKDSKWVLEEVHYALRHTLGMLIVSLPGSTLTPGTKDLPRITLQANQLETATGDQLILSQAALEYVTQQVEDIHAHSLVRRRRRLVHHTRTAAERGGYTVTEKPGPTLVLQRDDYPSAVVRFSPRPPRPEDLLIVDTERSSVEGDSVSAILVHAEESLRKPRAELLTWCAGTRELTVINDSAVADLFAHWTKAGHR